MGYTDQRCRSDLYQHGVLHLQRGRRRLLHGTGWRTGNVGADDDYRAGPGHDQDRSVECERRCAGEIYAGRAQHWRVSGTLRYFDRPSAQRRRWRNVRHAAAKHYGAGISKPTERRRYRRCSWRVQTSRRALSAIRPAHSTLYMQSSDTDYRRWPAADRDIRGTSRRRYP